MGWEGMEKEWLLTRAAVLRHFNLACYYVEPNMLQINSLVSDSFDVFYGNSMFVFVGNQAKRVRV